MTEPTSHLSIRQATRATFRSVVGEKPAIILVRKGEKRTTRDGVQQTIRSGQLVLLPAGVPLTIENVPSDGLYLATALVPDPALVPVGRPERLANDQRTLVAFERAAAAFEDPSVPEVLREHLVAEVLLWLAHEGIGTPRLKPRSLMLRLRALLSDSPGKPWTAPEASKLLAVSEATLRRRLAEEGASFRTVLIDLRMTRALSLLQTTSLPISEVALEVGYESSSRFAARFNTRFGLLPSAVRDSNDRLGT